MENYVLNYIKKHKLLSEKQKVGVAVSGGADSMALLNCLCGISKVYNINVYCIHFEHGLRGEDSLLDADFVTNYCAKNNIPFFMGAADVKRLAKKWGLSIQTAAKRAREDYFESLVKAKEVDVIATAHHTDDNAESVLMHIFRGSGTGGLVGIHPKIDFYVRPFLCVGRKDILFYLKQKSINYVEDKSNADNKYTRNYLRNVIFPQIEEHVNKDVKSALNKLCITATYDNDYLDVSAKTAFEKCSSIKNKSVYLEINQLITMHDAVLSRVIRLGCKALNAITDIEYSHIKAVMELVKTHKSGSKLDLSNHLCVTVEYNNLIICFTKAKENNSFCMPLNIMGTTNLNEDMEIICTKVKKCDFKNTDKYCECFDLDKLPKDIDVRTRQAGDYIFPLGALGKKKLKDYFIDKKLTQKNREKAIMLAYQNTIIWLIGHVISSDYAVNEHTTQILQIEYNGRKIYEL